MLPKVSVLMTTFNNFSYLDKAIDSVLNQSLQDFEYIIIDDASTDSTYSLLQTYAKTDPRIKVFQNECNVGLTKTLHSGLSYCRGKYIFRLDADDICHVDRFQKQVAYMDNNKDVAICGTQGWLIDSNGKIVGEKNLPCEYTDIKHKLLYNNQFIHSSLCIRRSILMSNGGYDTTFKKSQDYELVLRIAQRHKIVNLPDRLVLWRVHANSLSWKNKSQERFALRARWYAITRYDYPFFRGIFHIIIRSLWYLIPQRVKRMRYEY